MQKSFSDRVEHTVCLPDVSLDSGEGDGVILKSRISDSRGANVLKPYVLAAWEAEPMRTSESLLSKSMLATAG